MHNVKRVKPGPGQESVWDYPRPAVAEPVSGSFQVKAHSATIIDVADAVRVLETSHPPVYYFRVSDLQNAQLRESSKTSWCEWKGKANYFDLLVGSDCIFDAGWFYAQPNPSFAELERRFAIYPSKMDECIANGHTVTPQEGDFYGGWITSDVVGPFKGGPGSWGW